MLEQCFITHELFRGFVCQKFGPCTYYVASGDLPEPEPCPSVGKGVEFCAESEDGEVGERR